MTGVIQFLARVMLALIFIMAGIGKIMDPAGTVAYMNMMGVPGILLWPTIALELLGGIALVIGFKTRYTSLALAAFCLLAAAIFHRDFADKMQMIMCLKNIAIAGGLLLLSVQGRMPLSWDNRRTQTDFFGTRLERR
jgi:putative oxidoreductase